MSTETKHPLELELERFVCWVNCWADMDSHEERSMGWRRGYQEAVMDVLERVKPLAPNWLDTWRKEWIKHA